MENRQEIRVGVKSRYKTGVVRIEFPLYFIDFIDGFFKENNIPLTHNETVNCFKLTNGHFRCTTFDNRFILIDVVGDQYADAFQHFLWDKGFYLELVFSECYTNIYVQR